MMKRTDASTAIRIRLRFLEDELYEARKRGNHEQISMLDMERRRWLVTLKEIHEFKNKRGEKCE